MRVTFESGAWVDIRPPGELTLKDKVFVNSATLVAVDWVNQSATKMSMAQMMGSQYATMARVILSWSYEYIIPKDDISSDEDGQKTYEASLMLMPLDDYNELEDAIQPHLEKLRGKGPKERNTSTSNGSSKGRAVSSRRG